MLRDLETCIKVVVDVRRGMLVQDRETRARMEPIIRQILEGAA